MRFNENICRLCGKEFDNLDSTTETYLELA